MSKKYFVVKSVSKSPEGPVFHGDFIIGGEVTAGEGSSSQGRKALPRLDVFKPFELKWILGPNGEGKAFAEAAGYETVAHDDFSYPPRR